MWRFDPTAGLTDFDQLPGLRDAWNDFIHRLYDENINGVSGWEPENPGADNKPFAVEELRAWGRTASDLRFFDPLHMDVPANSIPANVNWSALPTSFNGNFGGETAAVLQFLDAPQRDPNVRVPTRVQDEYCEWVVDKGQNGKITKVLFTSEPPEYYDFLFNPPSGVDQDASRRLLVSIYRTILGEPGIQLEDLLDGNGNYNHWNRWNNTGCVHMQQPNNTLGAEINIAARSAILREAGGAPIASAEKLILCGQYGEPTRQSDPAIGASVNSIARQNRFVTLANPVGLYMADLDTSGWVTPDGDDPRSFWRVIRGTDIGDESKNMIVRAEFAVPGSKPYTVSDITIGGSPIQFGGQISANITMRLGVLQSPVSTGPAPRAIGCLGINPPGNGAAADFDDAPDRKSAASGIAATRRL
jgi:hypothetical protein